MIRDYNIEDSTAFGLGTCHRLAQALMPITRLDMGLWKLKLKGDDRYSICVIRNESTNTYIHICTTIGEIEKFKLTYSKGNFSGSMVAYGVHNLQLQIKKIKKELDENAS